MNLKKLCLTLGIVSMGLFLLPFLVLVFISISKTSFKLPDFVVYFHQITAFTLAILTLIIGYKATKDDEFENKTVMAGMVLATIVIVIKLIIWFLAYFPLF